MTTFNKGDTVQFKGDTYGSSKGLRAVVLQATGTSLIIERKGKFINRWFDANEFDLVPKVIDDRVYHDTPEDTFTGEICRHALKLLMKVDDFLAKFEKKNV